MVIYRGMMIVALLTSASYAEECVVERNSTVKSEQSEFNYIDETHANLSSTVLEWSETIDKTIGEWLGHKDVNCTNCTAEALDIKDTSDTSLEDKVRSADAFFQNRKYLDETDDVFIRLRTGGFFQSRGSEDYEFKLRAQIPFSRSKKHLKIFINDMTIDNADNILREDEKDTPNIGINYFAPEKHGISSRYALGFSGLDPFVSARYNMPFQTGNWLIDPVQLFKYSLDDKFEEETDIYFDRQFKEMSLFRLQLHRKTQEDIDGMNYALSVQYYWSPKDKTGLGFSQSFFGNTKYPYIVDENAATPQVKTYGGIHNYLTEFTWRQNVWRKWFYFEVRPSVNFHKQYDYDPNYAVRIFFDFYFGKYQ